MDAHTFKSIWVVQIIIDKFLKMRTHSWMGKERQGRSGRRYEDEYNQDILCIYNSQELIKENC